MLRKALIAIAILVVATAWEAHASGLTQGDGLTYWARMVAWIMAQQRVFHNELTEGLKTLSAGGGAGAAWGLIVASFLYGVFHAAGPGHGKAVPTTYLLTHKRRLGRGATLATAAAFCQGTGGGGARIRAYIYSPPAGCRARPHRPSVGVNG